MEYESLNLFVFFLKKPPGYKVFCEPERIHFLKKLNKSVLISITVYLENDKKREPNFNEEMLPFTL